MSKENVLISKTVSGHFGRTVREVKSSVNVTLALGTSVGTEWVRE